MNDIDINLAKRVLVRIVAKAICKSRSCEGAGCCQWPGNGGKHFDFGRGRLCPVDAGGYDNAALDAIVAYQKAVDVAEMTTEQCQVRGIRRASNNPTTEGENRE